MAPLTGPSGRAGHALSLRGDVTSEIFEKACRDELEHPLSTRWSSMFIQPLRCRLKKSLESLTAPAAARGWNVRTVRCSKPARAGFNHESAKRRCVALQNDIFMRACRGARYVQYALHVHLRP